MGRSPVWRAAEVDAGVGGRIRIRRIALGMTESELAAYLELEPAALRAIEDGVARPTAIQLYSIAQELGMPISYFFLSDGNGHATSSAGRSSQS